MNALFRSDTRTSVIMVAEITTEILWPAASEGAPSDIPADDPE
jgi:hypothetical protein